MKLSISDRLIASELAQSKVEGNRIDMMLIYDLIKLATFTPKEIEENGIDQNEKGLITCQKNPEIDVILTHRQLTILKEQLDYHSDRNLIHITWVPFMQKIDEAYKDIEQ